MARSLRGSEEHVEGVCRQDGHGGDHEDVLWDEERRDVVRAACGGVDLGEIDLQREDRVSAPSRRATPRVSAPGKSRTCVVAVGRHEKNLSDRGAGGQPESEEARMRHATQSQIGRRSLSQRVNAGVYRDTRQAPR